MSGLDSVKGPLNIVLALLLVCVIAGGLWYVSRLRSELTDLTGTNATLSADMAAAKQAAADSAAAAARAIQAASASAQHAAALEAAAAAQPPAPAPIENDRLNNIVGEAAHASAPDRICPAIGLPAALIRAVDRLFPAASAGRIAARAYGGENP